MKVELSASQVSNLVDFIEIEFIDSIRRDDDIDNIEYVISMMDALKALREASAKEKDSSQHPYKDFVERENTYVN